MQTRLLDAHAPRDVDVAVAILVDGGLVGIPSETVYGLAANASLPEAVRRVFAAKGRPADHPLILHVSDIAHARAASSDWTEAAEILARTFWPGPLTVIVTKSEGVDPVVTGGQDSVALRVPGHDVFLDVLRKLSDLGSIGIAAPSANRFGHVSPTTAQHVLDDLDGVIDGVLDGGSASIGVESTIVDCTVSPPRVLRPGGIPTEDIDLALEMAGHRVTDERGDGSSGVRASGMLASHYAPRARVALVEDEDEAEEVAATLRETGKHVVLLATDADPTAQARELFARLRQADAEKPDVIVAILPPDVGIGRAVRDRLFKAAATR
jgi:L-threonylcarbamoyladenylate synthase